ncbi:MAG: XdhC family protein [Bacteroidales bacterium]|nr:XdhC family protein [Bacteroidales bacterium]
MSQYFGYLIESEKHQSRAVKWINTPVKGSMPRKSVFKMLILPNGKIFGNYENNAIERLMIEKSKKMLQNNYPHIYRIH